MHLFSTHSRRFGLSLSLETKSIFLSLYKSMKFVNCAFCQEVTVRGAWLTCIWISFKQRIFLILILRYSIDGAKYYFLETVTLTLTLTLTLNLTLNLTLSLTLTLNLTLTLTLMECLCLALRLFYPPPLHDCTCSVLFLFPTSKMSTPRGVLSRT